MIDNGKMKLLEATYVGLESPFTKIRVKIQDGNKTKEGFFLFENDGRDFEVEGFGGELDRERVFAHQEELIHNDEASALLQPCWERGTKEFEVGPPWS